MGVRHWSRLVCDVLLYLPPPWHKKYTAYGIRYFFCVLRTHLSILLYAVRFSLMCSIFHGVCVLLLFWWGDSIDRCGPQAQQDHDRFERFVVYWALSGLRLMVVVCVWAFVSRGLFIFILCICFWSWLSLFLPLRWKCRCAYIQIHEHILLQ